MIPSQFEYVAPESVEEALAALAESGDDGKVLAGGQSLLPVLRLRLNTPETVVDLGRIAALREISEDGAGDAGEQQAHAAVVLQQGLAGREDGDAAGHLGHRRQEG